MIQNLADELVSLGLAIIPYLTIHPLVLAALTWLLGVVALGTGDLPKRGSADRREGRET